MPAFHLSALVDASLDTLNANPAVFAVLVAVALLVASKLVYLGFDHVRIRMAVKAQHAKIVWENPPVSPYPTRTFSHPAAKGFRVGYVDDRHVHQASRSIRDSHPDHRFNVSDTDRAVLADLGISIPDGPGHAA